MMDTSQITTLIQMFAHEEIPDIDEGSESSDGSDSSDETESNSFHVGEQFAHDTIASDIEEDRKNRRSKAYPISSGYTAGSLFWRFYACLVQDVSRLYSTICIGIA